MTTLIILAIAIVLVYVGVALQVFRRLAWHMIQDKDEFDREDSYIGAFVLSFVVLPIGAMVLCQMNRAGGRGSFLLPPKAVRQKQRIEELERQLEIR